MQRLWRPRILCIWMTIFGLWPMGASAGYVVGDFRHAIEPASFEAGAVGLLVNAGHICSVTLIGLRLAATNRHCLEPLKAQFGVKGDPNHLVVKQGSVVGAAVATGVINGQAADFFPIREAWISPSGDADEDWAVMVLNPSAKPGRPPLFPGQLKATFALAPTSMIASVSLLAHAGYSESYFRANRRGHTQNNVHMIAREGHLIRHDGANSRGASGGPVWLAGTRELVAINANESCASTYAANEAECAKHGLGNGAVTVETFASVIDALQREGN